MLRKFFAKRMGVESSSLTLQRTSKGKPVCEVNIALLNIGLSLFSTDNVNGWFSCCGQDCPAGLNANVSHDGFWVILVGSEDVLVGCDVMAVSARTPDQVCMESNKQ